MAKAGHPHNRWFYIFHKGKVHRFTTPESARAARGVYSGSEEVRPSDPRVRRAKRARRGSHEALVHHPKLPREEFMTFERLTDGARAYVLMGGERMRRFDDNPLWVRSTKAGKRCLDELVPGAATCRRSQVAY